MSAIRSTDKRRSNRTFHSSPYARPAVSKKSSWSIAGILSYLNPLRSRSPVDEINSQSEPDADSPPPSPTPSVTGDAPETLSARGAQLASNLSLNDLPNSYIGSSPPRQQLQPRPNPFISAAPVTPIRAADPYHLPESSSPAKNLETVTTFLTERRGKLISEIEVEGLVSLIQKSTPPDKPEPFRFSSSTPSTPNRGNSPSTNNLNINFGFTPSPVPPFPSASSSTQVTSRKTLSKNPNGVYRWAGGGSAKRSRNRYQSPAFGPSRSTPERLKMSSAEVPPVPRMDTKRRRVGEEAESSTATPSGNAINGVMPPRSSAPGPSPTRSTQAFPFPVSNTTPLTPSPTVNGTSSTPKLNGTAATPSRLRTTIPLKPTAPAVPSPLRQTWGQAQTDPSPPQLQRQTKAANFMTELIKEVTPPRRPDVSNPYQTASPVRTPAPGKAKPKRTRATGKPSLPFKERKEKESIKTNGNEEENDGKDKPQPIEEFSPQTIIEATVPKGSKRSRPPTFDDPILRRSRDDRPELPISSDLRGNSGYPVGVDPADEEDEVDERTSKKPKGNGNGGIPKAGTRKAKPPLIIFEEVDVDMPLAEKSVGKRAEDDETMKPSDTTILPTASTSPASNNGFFGSSTSAASGNISSSVNTSGGTSRPLFGALKSSSAPKEPSKLRYSYQPDGTSAPPTPMPASQSFIEKSQPTLNESSKSVAMAIDVSEVPEMKENEKGKSVDPKEAALAVAVDALPTYVFRAPVSETNAIYADARDAAKSLPKSSLPSFEFTAKAKAKPETHETKSATVVAPASAPVKAFDWAAAGMKAPAGAGGTSWTCSTCMLSNPLSAVDKCTLCESPR